jgi:hypothetical protein
MRKRRIFRFVLLDIINSFVAIANSGIQKVKLKVGKARPKAANFTDTSFKSKGRCPLTFLTVVYLAHTCT